MAVSLSGRSFLKLLDVTPAEIRYMRELSKEFKPSRVYEILNDALPTLSDEDMRAMVEAMEKMDEIQKRRKTGIRIGILFLLAVVLFLAGGISLYLRTPAHVIGQANAMTQIQVSGS